MEGGESPGVMTEMARSAMWSERREGGEYGKERVKVSSEKEAKEWDPSMAETGALKKDDGRAELTDHLV